MSDDFRKKNRELVAREHEAMRQCPKCGSEETTFELQKLAPTSTGEFGDVLVYVCRCGHCYERRFPLPTEYIPSEAREFLLPKGAESV